MTLLIGFLTFILVVNCLFLILLVLIQLPKKEAGAGIAFGGAATDALFGAGSGNALTKVTKYSATLFVGMSVLLSMLNMQAVRQGSRRLEEEISKQAAANPARLAVPTNTIARTAPAATGATTQATPAATTTNLLMSTATNQAANSTPAVTPEAPVNAPATTTPAAPVTPTPAPPK
jgi:protein translocase SecG subunit